MSLVETHNFVSVCSFARPIPLIPLAIALGGRCDKKNFHRTVVRCAESGIVSHIFGLKGGVVCMGASSPEEALLVQHRLAEAIFDHLRISVRIVNSMLCNVVCSVRLPGIAFAPDPTVRISLDLLFEDACSELFKPVMSQPARYMPERFDSVFLYVHYKGLTTTMAISDTGHGVACGVVHGSIELLNEFMHTFKEYRVGKEYRTMTSSEQASTQARRSLVKKKAESAPKARARRNAQKRKLVIEEQNKEIQAAREETPLERAKRQRVQKEEKKEEEPEVLTEEQGKARFFRD